MATLIATAGSATANSLGTLNEALNYFEAHLYAASFTALEDDPERQEAALLHATRRLERFSYKGVPANPLTGVTQKLKWPRSGVVNEEGLGFLDSTVVPQQIKEACFEVALWLLKSDPSAAASDELRQFKKLNIAGALEMEMREAIPLETPLPAAALRLLSPFLTHGTSARLIRA